jgi:glycosyltransferase involved in cell wall biosynthesis
MVTPHLPPALAANALLPTVLARELTSLGWQSVFLAHPAPQAPKAEGVSYVRKRGVGALSRTPVGAVTAATRIALAAARACRSVDLVHLHGNGLIIEVAARMAAVRARPCVITLYGTDVWHFDAARHARFARVVKGAAQRVFYSCALRDRARELGLADGSSAVIYAPVDHAFSLPSSEARETARQDLSVDGPLLLTVKRLHPVGGHDVLLRAMAELVRLVPNVRLIIAGDGELRGELERLSVSLGLESRVRFVGQVDNRDLPRYYAAADLFVLPSRIESWGTVMLEALACGTRVVATDTAGAREAHGYFERDIMLETRATPDALAAAIAAALREDRRVGDDTLRRIESMFRPGDCARSYRAVYEAAIHP